MVMRLKLKALSWAMTISLLYFNIPSTADASAVATSCNTEDDLDFDKCDVHHLQIPVLKSICERLGLDLENEIFPYVLDKDLDEFDETNANNVEESNTFQPDTDQATAERSHADYVEAAKECLSIEAEMELMLEREAESLDQFENELADEDMGFLSEIMSEIISKDPNMIDEVLEILKKDDPEIYEAMFDGMVEEERTVSNILGNHDALAEIINLLLTENPEFYRKLNEDIYLPDDVVDGFDAIEDEEVVDEEVLKMLEKMMGAGSEL